MPSNYIGGSGVVTCHEGSFDQAPKSPGAQACLLWCRATGRCITSDANNLLMIYAAASLFWKIQPIWGLTDTSVAQGCRPGRGSFPTVKRPEANGFGRFLIGIEAGCAALAGSLAGILLCILVRVLVDQCRCRRSFAHRPRTSPECIDGIVLIKACNMTRPTQLVLDWRPQPGHRLKVRKGSRPGVQTTAGGRLLLLLCGFASLPSCVWAVPASLGTFCRTFAHLAPAPTLTSQVAPGDFHIDLDELPWEPRVDNSGLPEDSCVDLPALVHGDAPYPQDCWLGVTVYAPHFQTVAFGLRVERPTDLSHVLALLPATGRLPCAEHDGLAAVSPQVLPGSLSVISYPTVITQGKQPHCAVVLDLSRVGGICHASVLPVDIMLQDFLFRIRTLLNVDVLEEAADSVKVWVGDAVEPASQGGRLCITHGTLITVCRSHFGAPHAAYSERLFSPNACWVGWTTFLSHFSRIALLYAAACRCVP